VSRAADPLLSFRGEFPILSNTTYLISNSLGAMPRAAETALAEYARTWATRGVRAWSQLRRAGMERIREKSLRQTERLLALADARGFVSATPREPERRGGTVAVDFEGALAVSRELNARDVLVDYRPGVGIRLSPHFYTEDAELDRAFAVIDEIRANGPGRRWKSRPSLVT
jgi:kynureninase